MAIETFRYDKPEFERAKRVERLVRSDLLKADVQVVREGGENNLHSHTGNDGFWLVLKGRVAFYGEGDEPVAELGEMEGALVPRGTMYWFESVGDEELEILHVAAFAREVEDARVDHDPRKRPTRTG